MDKKKKDPTTWWRPPKAKTKKTEQKADNFDLSLARLRAWVKANYE